MSPDGGTLHVLTGPSGVGKDVVLAELVRLGDDYHLPVTATTRSPRPGERDGVDYSFVSVDRFRQMIDGGEMIEWAEVYGNYYGVPAHEVDDALAAGRNVILKVDVQGARTIRDARPDAVLVFLAPPDLPTLERRLRVAAPRQAPSLRSSSGRRHRRSRPPDGSTTW